ncbi:MAG: NAD-dependent deacylase [Deltaproteobacteria bacterium]|nr:NAD-dependent deacylase [Deltaproteobacteria bacterium]
MPGSGGRGPLDLAEGARVTFLTGAGVSVASGLRPYRGPGGIWNEVDASAWATAAAIERDPASCWRAHREFHGLVARAQPNAAHRAIAALERRFPERVTVITQNVDSLHARAGSTKVIEIHGSLGRVRCTRGDCTGGAGSAPDPSSPVEVPPPCPSCGRPLRYDIVLFDEYLAAADERAARDALRACDVFIAAGTSGVVSPAASYAREADYAGARTILVNLEPPEPPNPYFAEIHLGRAEEILPALLG